MDGKVMAEVSQPYRCSGALVCTISDIEEETAHSGSRIS